APLRNPSTTSKLPSPGSQPVVSTDAGTPTDRTVAQTWSLTGLGAPTTQSTPVSGTVSPIAGGGTGLALYTQVRAAAAPVTLFKGTPNELKIEALSPLLFTVAA